MTHYYHYLKGLEDTICTNALPEFRTTTRAIRVRETREMSAMDSLMRMKDLMIQFVGSDPQRTGCLPPDEFRAVMSAAGPLLIGGISGQHEIDNIVSLCLKMYREPMDDTVCYLDMWCTLLAGIINTNGESGFNGTAVMEILTQIKRGVELSQAKATVEYITMVQFPQRYDSSWVSRDHTNRAVQGLQGQFNYSMTVGSSESVVSIESSVISMVGGPSALLPRDGEWQLDAPQLPTGEPGMMTIKTVRAKELNKWQVKQEKCAVKPTEEMSAYRPDVIPTLRKGADYYGETVGAPSGKFESNALLRGADASPVLRRSH